MVSTNFRTDWTHIEKLKLGWENSKLILIPKFALIDLSSILNDLVFILKYKWIICWYWYSRERESTREDDYFGIQTYFNTRYLDLYVNQPQSYSKIMKAILSRIWTVLTSDNFILRAAPTYLWMKWWNQNKCLSKQVSIKTKRYDFHQYIKQEESEKFTLKQMGVFAPCICVRLTHSLRKAFNRKKTV